VANLGKMHIEYNGIHCLQVLPINNDLKKTFLDGWCNLIVIPLMLTEMFMFLCHYKFGNIN